MEWKKLGVLASSEEGTGNPEMFKPWSRSTWLCCGLCLLFLWGNVELAFPSSQVRVALVQKATRIEVSSSARRTEFVLLESKLGPRGPRYTKRASVPLVGSTEVDDQAQR